MGITLNVAMGFLSHYSEEASPSLKDGLYERLPLLSGRDGARDAADVPCGLRVVRLLSLRRPGLPLPSGVVHCKMDHQTRWIGETFLDFFRDWATRSFKHPDLHLTGEAGIGSWAWTRRMRARLLPRADVQGRRR